jgi:hypothetical protein
MSELTPDTIEQQRNALKCAMSNLWTEQKMRLETHAKIDALCDMALRSLRQPEREGWVSVSKPPEDGSDVLVWKVFAHSPPMVQVDYSCRPDWWRNVTHWMPLPAPPVAALQSEEK